MISAFFKEFQVNTHLRTASTGKSKGIPLGMVFKLVFLLVFMGKNLYRLIETQPTSPLSKIPFTVSSRPPPSTGGPFCFGSVLILPPLPSCP